MLYRLEKAAWICSDHLIKNYPQLRNQVGGYVSYPMGDSLIVTAFYHFEANQHILIRYQSDLRLSPESLKVSATQEIASDTEKSLITIRQEALAQIQENRDHFFMTYEATSFNLIPVLGEKMNRVYVLTAAHGGNEVILGNDYLLEYTTKNELAEVYKLHHSLVRLPFNAPDEQTISATMHTHVLASHIEPTDVCTLLLYRDLASWKQHYVIHANYVSIMDMEKESLSIISRKAFDKMNK